MGVSGLGGRGGEGSDGCCLLVCCVFRFPCLSRMADVGFYREVSRYTNTDYEIVENKTNYEYCILDKYV